MIRRGLVALVAIAALGCATRYATGPRLEHAPSPDPASDSAVLYVFRETAQPKEYPAHVDIDGEEAIALDERGFTWVYLSPGRHEFVFRWPWTTGLTKTAMPRVRFTQTFEPGRTYVYALQSSIDPRVFVVESRSRVVPMEPKAGLEAIRLCCSYVLPARQRFTGRT